MDGADEGIVPQGQLVGKRNQGKSSAGHDSPVEKRKRPEKRGVWGNKDFGSGANDGYGLVGLVVGVAGFAAGFCCAGAAPAFTG